MGLDFEAHILLDDNTPTEEPDFTNSPSRWSLANDYGLSGCKDYEFFSAIGYHEWDEYVAPLFPLRGLPDVDLCSEITDYFEDYDSSWLNYKEFCLALEHSNINRKERPKYVQVLCGVLEHIASVYGETRVILLFQFNW